MELNAEQIKKALECCANETEDCNNCPYWRGYDENCFNDLKMNALALINSQEQRIKGLETESRQYYYEQRKLVEAHDTYKEYAENMQLFVEKMVHLEDKGYEPSAARYAAEMDMWRAVALEKKRLTEENEKIGIENFALIRKLSLIKEDTVRKMGERLKAQKFTHKNFGELVYVEDIDQIAKEMLEGEK